MLLSKTARVSGSRKHSFGADKHDRLSSLILIVKIENILFQKHMLTEMPCSFLRLKNMLGTEELSVQN